MEFTLKPHSLFTDYDVYLFRSGKHIRLYERFGSHLLTLDDEEGCYFAVFAPAAKSVAVIGDFNGWVGDEHELKPRWDESGIWEGFITGIKAGDLYKYHIESTNRSLRFDKIDPYAFHFQTPPSHCSIVWDLKHNWNDKSWMKNRAKKNELNCPYSIYEVHLGSWRRHADGNPFSYRLLAKELVTYVKEMGFTHVELMPVMEHPYDPSWGYQVTGYFAATSRFGTPQDLMELIEAFHEAGIGVIMDWVPAHFPSDGHALSYFDGSHVYEHPDTGKGYHPDWKSLIFNFERNEIRSFLLSSAFFWMEVFHADSLRVDAVASMLYLDYSRKEGEWQPNIYGGNEYLAAISFIKDFNEALYNNVKDIHTIAEESTSFAGVTHPIQSGGLGFGMKWMMGWMHDTIDYFKKPPIYRKFHQNNVTFSIVYAFSENFILPFSHDEVVHGKASMIYKMPGDEWQKFANLRAMYGYMFTHPGGKLLFMGSEFAQTTEWNFKAELPWSLLQFEPHKGIQQLVKDLNKLYTTEKAMYELQFDPKGFEWLDFSNHEASIIAYIRKNEDIDENIIVLCNFNTTPHEKYRFGVSQKGSWKVILNTDDEKYGGSGYCTSSSYEAESETSHGKAFSIEAALPPLGVVILKKA
ncbi:MAG: 1,4-alpha-glucan branching protein GlgB [Saprospiraceae bacterium]|nr:1,4-alpha-glucan branching protein GlgB [Saprospiraceae bacterium]